MTSSDGWTRNEFNPNVQTKDVGLAFYRIQWKGPKAYVWEIRSARYNLLAFGRTETLLGAKAAIDQKEMGHVA